MRLLDSKWIALMVSAVVCGLLFAYGFTEETPLGGLEGRAVMKENGQPLANALIMLTPLIQPQEAGREALVKSYSLTTDKNGRFSSRRLVAGAYTLSASAKAHTLASVPIALTEGQKTSVDLELEPNQPYLDLYASQHVFTPDEKPVMEMHGFSPNDKMEVELYRVKTETIVKNGGMQSVLQSLSSWNQQRKRPEEVGQSVATQPVEITEQDAEGMFVQTVELPKLAEGFYYVECRLGDLKKGAYFNISRIALVTKTDGNQTFCFATDLKTGAPLQAKIARLDAPSGARQELGQTSADGTLKVAAQGTEFERTFYLADTGGSQTLVETYPSEQQNQAINGFLVTDRPIYRPGDTVQFKGIVRKRATNDYQLPGTGQVKIAIYDADGGLIENQTATLNAHGTFSGSFSTSRETKPGGFKIECEAFDSTFEKYVAIASYRKPEISLSILPKKPYYLLGEQAEIDVKAQYFNGGAVPGSPVTIYVYRERDYSAQWGGESEDYGGGEAVENMTETTDENGVAHFKITTKPAKNETQSEFDYRYRIEASLETPSEQYADGTGGFRVTQGSFALKTELNEWIVRPGDTVDLSLETVTHLQQKPVPNQTVRVEVGTETWDGNTSRFHALNTLSARTGADGKAVLHVPIKETGSIVLRAIAPDGSREVISSQYLWVEGGTASRAPDAAKISLKLDRESYHVGDNFTALIQTDKPGGAALVTVEAGELLATQVVILDEASKTVHLPIDARFAPNAFVTVTRINEKSFLTDQQPLKVEQKARQLKIEIKSDKTLYEPGGKAIYTVQTTDSKGNPVSAEVSFGVVDEAIYALQKDDTDIQQGFFPDRYNHVRTDYSFPELYLDGGDKGEVDLKIRTKFKDTAYWNPHVVTDAKGQATVEVALPDNLTQWRATAIGISDVTQVGMSTQTVRVDKPLTVRLGLPQYLVAGDRQQISATIRNNWADSDQVSVELAISGSTVEGDRQQTLSIAANQQQTLTWFVQPSGSGVLSVKVKAQAGSDADAVQQTVKIQAHGRLRTDRQAGSVSGSTEVKLNRRADADPNSGKLTVSLSPTVGNVVFQSLDELIDFPYGCVEQTMSRFLPTVLLTDALKGTPIPAGRLPENTKAMVEDGFARLKRMQHGSGAWGWWEYDQDNAFMTAYVLDGLLRAKAAGYESNVTIQPEAIRTLMNAKETSPRDGAYLALMLTEYGKPEMASEWLAKHPTSKTPTTSELAYRARLCHRLGGAHQEEAKQLLIQLIGKANETSTTVFWPQDTDAWGAEPSAVALLAIQELTPESPLILKAIRSLIDARQGDIWSSTRDTSFTLMALTTHLKQTNELAGNGAVQLTLNGQPWKSITYGPDSLFNRAMQVELPLSSLKTGENKLGITQSGTGVCYYSVELKQYAVSDRLGALLNGSGLAISRSFHRLETQRMEDGTLQLSPTKKPVTSVQTGDLIECIVTVSSERERDYVLVEVPTPSNTHVQERGDVDAYDWGWWWSNTSVYDDRVAFFARTLPKGKSTFSFTFRAEADGRCSALPASVCNMYDPSDLASSEETLLEVR